MKWRAPATEIIKEGVRTNLNPWEYHLLMTLCAEKEISKSYGISLMISKCLNLMYDDAGNKINELEDIVITRPENIDRLEKKLDKILYFLEKQEELK